MIRVSLLIAASALAAGAPAVGKPRGPAITPSSPDALLLVKAPRLSIPYVLGLSAYDPVERQLRSRTFSGGWVSLKVGRVETAGNEDELVIRKVKPGTYVLRDVTQQTAWGLCFHAQSYQFEIKPGQVLYLGRFDGKAALRELQARVVQSGNLRGRQGQVNHYFETVPAPPLAPATETGLAQARSLLAATLPQTTSKVEAATLSPATFGTGRDLFGLQRICGGWHQKKGKPLPEERATAGG